MFTSDRRASDLVNKKRGNCGVLRTLQRLGVILQRGGADARRGAGAARPLLHATGGAAAGFAAAARLLAKGDGLKVLRAAEQKKRERRRRASSDAISQLTCPENSERLGICAWKTRELGRCVCGFVDVAPLAWAVNRLPI